MDVKVQVSLNCTSQNYLIQISGITAYYSDGIAKESKLMIINFYYNSTYESCTNHFCCVISLLFLDNKEYNKFVSNHEVYIRNSVFSNLKNSSILCYYGEANHDRQYNDLRISVIIENSKTLDTIIGHACFILILRVYQAFILQHQDLK